MTGPNLTESHKRCGSNTAGIRRRIRENAEMFSRSGLLPSSQPALPPIQATQMAAFIDSLFEGMVRNNTSTSCQRLISKAVIQRANHDERPVAREGGIYPRHL
jgi:hypothetical protein